ncbi:conjugation transfer protein [Defluviimonas sp. 20V17]|uniref:Conjugation transfer protein n=1 Tax=Allgaiera indica TaxID=765699 RepID=A0AAN4UP81_9RHOB|nr:hemolysin family protein [Allgaiera indica]KDB03715.1 conjugation transfer protein [Defluviimonas sp. 20V17]GHD99821.1 conjugation transfer protein [Allgaiera indica]SDW42875.1 magnesium and cobalt transporter [Allgaiera indica]
MDSRSEGSSAAHGAQDLDPPEPPGFFSRLFSALSPGEAETSPATRSAPAPDTPAPQAAFGISNLRRLRVDDVAIPKAEITAVPVEIGKEALVEVFREHGFSRLPVYKGTLDKPLGLVLLKDLALTYGFGNSGGRFSLRKLLRPVLYAPPSMPVGVLLQKMQKERVHMALVIDEYGGVDGLVTIEDLIETVIGEIEDEHDDTSDTYWQLEKPGAYIVQARAPLDEFEAETGLDLSVEGEDEEEVDTLGGLVFLMCGRVPARGEVIRHESGAEFEVIDADPRRIKRLRVRLPGSAPAASASPAPPPEKDG